MRRPHPANGHSSPAVDSIVNLSFNVPFASTLSGPEIEDVLHSSPGAFQRWTFQPGTPEGTPVHKLQVHAQNVETLRRLCRQISETSGGRIEATVTSSEPKTAQSIHRKSQGLVTNVCISGESEMVHKMRAKILNETPISLVGSKLSGEWRTANNSQRSAIVDIDTNLIMDANANGIRTSVLEHIDLIARYTGTDIFLLRPKSSDSEAIGISYGAENGLDQRFRTMIFGDLESVEHAKTRTLMMIDQIASPIPD